MNRRKPNREDRTMSTTTKDHLNTTAHGVVLFGRVRPNPGADSRCVEASGETYDAALASLRALVPEGAQLLAVARWPL